MSELSDTLTIAEITDFLATTPVFEGLAPEAVRQIAPLAYTRACRKGDIIFSPLQPTSDFILVKSGLVKVSIYSAAGFKLTYLLAEHGEPLNLVSPFTCTLRSTAAETLTDVLLVCLRQKNFLPFVMSQPHLIINAVSILGKAIDSANLRIIDLIEKRVEDRLARVLYTLYTKFGSPLRFTSFELAALTGTTSESTLRALGQLRDKGWIRSEKGQTIILNPAGLIPVEKETLWL